MNKELLTVLTAALEGRSVTNFSTEDTNTAAVKAIMEACGLNENSTARDLREKEAMAFALIEEAIDEILPKKLENIVGQFAEVKTFGRDDEVVFNIDKIGKNRAKLTISKGARGGIYRAAKLDSKYFSLATSVYTVAVYVTLEDIILGRSNLGELYANVMEGMEEIVYKETFEALASGSAVAGYNRIGEGKAITSTTKESLTASIDKVVPYVKQYGVPTVFGSYAALDGIANPAASNHPELEDSRDRRNYGFVQVYKGMRVVELPNYLVEGNWAYDPSYVFVIPSDTKPVKVALRGDLYIQRNTAAVGSEKWEAHKLMGVGLAMANNFAVIKVTDVDLGLGD